MIRQMEFHDAEAVAAIYNEYVENSVATFDTEPVDEGDMGLWIFDIASSFPCFVYEEDDEILGYCYAQPWNERDAYRYTLETTVYVARGREGKGIGEALMRKLIEECRRDGYHALIACITEGNAASDALHVKLGFKRVAHFKEVGLKFERWLDVADYELLLS